jgi:hypothetical protein
MVREAITIRRGEQAIANEDARANGKAHQNAE